MHWLIPSDLADFSAGLWLGVACVFVLGGLVKGTLGVGLPLVVVPLLSLKLAPPVSIALVVIPVIASNAWQVYDTRASRSSFRRFLPLLVTLLISTLITVPMTLRFSNTTLNVMLAVAVIVAVILMAVNPRVHIPPEREPLAGAIVGLVSGALGGVSSLTGPVIISYLMSLKLEREDFVGSISVIYLLAAVVLYGAMAYAGRLDGAHIALSLLAMAPLTLGMHVGKLLRGRLSEVWFRRCLLAFLSVIAVALAFK
jgi:uncharacterized membrane protein YfcA